MRNSRNTTLRLSILVFVVFTAICVQSLSQEGILYRFQGSPDGALPYAGLITDEEGNFFGTTMYGGTGPCEAYYEAAGCGTVFELSPPLRPGGAWPSNGQGSWNYTALRQFVVGGTDGEFPFSPLVWGRDGQLYGTTQLGGVSQGCPFFDFSGCGTVFRVAP